MTFYPNILHPKQRHVLEKLTVLGSLYLAGGTALALQLGHRTSLDLDFYSEQKLESKQLAARLGQLFSSINISRQTGDTFQCTAGGVNVSVFYYPYPLVKPLVDFPPVQLASLEDIAAMKIVAIIQRARQRDFWDMYYLIGRLGMNTIMHAVYKKYPWYEENNQIVFRALTYFDDADNDQEVDRVTIFDKNITWANVKERIKNEVAKHLEATP